MGFPHEAVPLCGSFEVQLPDGRPSRFFYWDDIAGRRLRDRTWLTARPDDFQRRPRHEVKTNPWAASGPWLPDDRSTARQCRSS
jgi:hypothetical protein